MTTETILTRLTKKVDLAVSHIQDLKLENDRIKNEKTRNGDDKDRTIRTLTNENLVALADQKAAAAAAAQLSSALADQKAAAAAQLSSALADQKAAAAAAAQLSSALADQKAVAADQKAAAGLTEARLIIQQEKIAEQLTSVSNSLAQQNEEYKESAKRRSNLIEQIEFKLNNLIT